VAQRTAEDPFQSLHLIIASQLDEFLRNGSFNATEHGPDVPNENQRSTDDIRSVLHLMYASKDLPRGMAAKKIIFPPPVQSRAHTRVLRTS